MSGKVIYDKTRGYRNNNAGNIRHGASKWQGMRGVQTDSAFVQFVAPEYGIRALVKILQSYNKRGITTISQIIKTYAPSSENDTQAYINDVLQTTELADNAYIDVFDYWVLDVLVKAIIKHENGVMLYPQSIIDKGLALAGYPKP